jgi:hypothetical protein
LLVPVGTWVLLRGAPQSVDEVLVMLGLDEFVEPAPNMLGPFQNPNAVPLENPYYLKYFCRINNPALDCRCHIKGLEVWRCAFTARKDPQRCGSRRRGALDHRPLDMDQSFPRSSL